MPIPLFDKATGEIDADVARSWEKYDICKFLAKRPKLLASSVLQGKIHVICGVEDNYYLNGACKSLRKLVCKKKSEKHASNGNASGEAEAAVPNYVSLVAGDHTTIRNRAHYKQIYDEIARVFKSSNTP